jgi:carbon storage regulator
VLVLSRHVNESIIVGDNIVIDVLSIGRDRVRLGVTAPPEVVINRSEVQEKLDRERLDREEKGA